MLMQHRINVPIALALAASLVACSGGSSGSVMPGSQRAVSAAFVIKVPPRPSASAHSDHRAPQFVDALTKSISVALTAVNGAAPSPLPAPVVVNLTSADCVPSSQGTTCTITISAAVGNDTFSVTAFPQTNATGKPLSVGKVTAPISASGPNNVAVALSGIVASMVLSLPAPPPVGTPTNIPLTVVAKDAVGTQIVGSEPYTTPIALSDNDKSGTTKLSTAAVVSPATVVTLNYNGGTLPAPIVISANAPSTPKATVTFLPSSGGTITEFTVPTAGAAPWGIAAGPDGNLWFTESGAGKIGRITTTGTITEFVIPTANAAPFGLTAGPDGNLWFAESSGNKIGKITTAGVFTEYPVRTPASSPWDVTAGPDGNLWFTELGGNKVGKITTVGAITEFAVPTMASSPTDIATGPDGNLWFSENAGNNIGKVSTAGAFTEYPVPATAAGPYGIVSGPDGNLWFTGFTGNCIAKITTGGLTTEYPVPTAGAQPIAIVVGPDGNLWFTETGNSKVGRITTGGAITEFSPPTGGASPVGIAPGEDGNLWFTESTGNKIGRIAP
jgi:streptogramin lyase